MWVLSMALPASSPEASAEPALKPNQPTQSSDQGEHEVVRRHVFLAVALSLADHEAAHQGGDAGVEMDDQAAGEVEHARRTEEAAAPYPVSHRHIDEEQPQAHEPHHRRELHAFGEGAGDDRRRDDGEGRLIHQEDVLRHRLGEIVDAAQQILAEGARQRADHAVQRPAIGEGQRIAGHEPQHRHQRGDREGLHAGREHVLLAHHAGVEQRQARDVHHQHQHRGHQQPCGVAGVDLGLVGRRCGRSNEHCARQRRAEAQNRVEHLPPRVLSFCLPCRPRSFVLSQPVRARWNPIRRCGCAPPARRR
jgi:hypothetical protein